METEKINKRGAWGVLFLLFLANLFNFFDRTIPAIIVEPVRKEWSLTDTQLGVISAVFTIVYAIAGIPLGRLADRLSRKKIIGWGLGVWSAFTALNGIAWNYMSFLLIRAGVGIGEASYAPAANSMIGDMFKSEKRARAIGIFMLGLPLGLMLAFFSVGFIIEAFESWRAAFYVAAIPGLILAIIFFFIREPERGGMDTVAHSEGVDKPFRRIMKVKTMWWIILSGLTFNFAAYATNAFMVPMMQRFFHFELLDAALATGVIVGITGLLALTLGGWVADRLHEKFPNGRLAFGTISLLVGSVLVLLALRLDATQGALFIGLYSAGWFLCYNYYTTVYPAVQDVIVPRLRASAMALYFAAMYLLGAAVGPVIVGWISDTIALKHFEGPGSTGSMEFSRGIGLHDALFTVPITVLATALFMFLAMRYFVSDARAMREGRS
ncbi:MAG TPA: MFS transporter [Leptospiraceae bacterium]|nr:MFS transporter [Spirochaetaceae bacterium]HBS04034.1 MFS transporter [Leptospiraceae bacterium]